jgi:rubrerythrin
MANKPQSQAAVTDQLCELIDLANREGLYDAADWIAVRVGREALAGFAALEGAGGQRFQCGECGGYVESRDLSAPCPTCKSGEGGK